MAEVIITVHPLRVVSDMSKCRIVAGALIEGDGDDDADGNAGTWIQLVLMLEEVRCYLRMLVMWKCRAMSKTVLGKNN